MFDIDTVTFLHYLEFYKNIYDMTEDERPVDRIINNCLLCDEWLKEYSTKKKMEHNKMSSSGGSGKQRTTVKF